MNILSILIFCLFVFLKAKVIHHQYRRTIFGYLGDYYDRNDIDLDVIHENRLTSMTNLFVNSAGMLLAS